MSFARSRRLPLVAQRNDVGAPTYVDVARGMASLRDLVAAEGVPDTRDYLTAVSEESTLLAGSGVPAIRAAGYLLPSGLWVPATVTLDPGPADTARVFITGEDLFGLPVGLDELQAAVAETSIVEALIVVSDWLRQLHAPGADHRQVDLRFAAAHLPPAVSLVARNLLAQPHRVLVSEQALYLVLKLACATAPDLAATVDDSRFRALGMAVVAVTDHLDTETVSEDEPVSLGRELLRNQAFNYRQAESALLSSYRRRWIELPLERMNESRVIDLSAEYERATKVPLADVGAMAMLLWTAAIAHGSAVTPDCLAATGWSHERIQAALRPMVIDLADLRSRVIREVDRYGWVWAVNTFAYTPVVRMPNGVLIVVDPYLVLRRGFGAPLLQDFVDGLDQAAASRARQCLDHVTELYALEALAAVVGDAGASRLYTEQDLRRAFGRKRSTADAAVDYGADWLVVEVTTTALRRSTLAGGTAEDIEDDLSRYVDKVQQLDATIKELRADETRLTGAAPHARRFVPVLVLEDGFPINPVSLRTLRQMASVAGYLEGADVDALEVLELDELVMVEGLQQARGWTLVELLRMKSKSAMREMGLRNFVMLTLRENPQRPTSQQRRTQAVFGDVIRTLGVQPSGSGELA